MVRGSDNAGLGRSPNKGADGMLTPFEEDLEVGSRFADRFTILGVVGRGSMGIVYQARHELMGRTVAIKMLRGQLASDERSMRRFEREARAASRMDHPNLISVHDFGLSENRQPYLVMDFAQGCTLYETQRQHERISPVRAVRIFTQACDALQHAHLQGVIHRDLKPSNIMLIERDGEPDFVKVFDLGIAKIAWGEEEDREPLTRTNEVCGSPIYLSPEQCKHLTLDNRSDIYSMGVLMYELLTGVPPLMGETVYDTIYMHVHEQPRPFSQVRADLHIPSRMERIVFKALEKDPDNRHQSMQELKWELQASLQASDPHLQVLPPDMLMQKRKPGSTGQNLDAVDSKKTQPIVMQPLPPVAPVPPATAAAAANMTPLELAVARAPKISATQAALISSVVTVALTLCGVFMYLSEKNAPASRQSDKSIAAQPPDMPALPTVEPEPTQQQSVPPVAARLNPTEKKRPPVKAPRAISTHNSAGSKSASPTVGKTAATAGSANHKTASTTQPPKRGKLVAQIPMMDKAPQPAAASGNPFFSIFQGVPGSAKQEAQPVQPAATPAAPAAQQPAERAQQTATRQPTPSYWQSYTHSQPSHQQVEEPVEQQTADGPSREAIMTMNEGIAAMGNDPSLAIQKFQQSLRLYPGYTKAKLNLARAKVNMGNRLLTSDRQGAMSCYKEAMDIFRRNGDNDAYQRVSTFYNQVAGSY
jgi:serine/threonine protein kinase